MQYRVVPIWGWLRLDVFKYKKFIPAGLHVRIEGRSRRRFLRSTAEDPGEDVHQRSATAGSTYRQNRIREVTFIQRTDQLIDGRRSRRRPPCRGSATGSTHRGKNDQDEDLHPESQRQEQLIHERGSRTGSSPRGSVTGSTHRRKRIKKGTLIQRIRDGIDSLTNEDQGVNLHRQRIHMSFDIYRPRKEGHPSQHLDQHVCMYVCMYVCTFVPRGSYHTKVIRNAL